LGTVVAEQGVPPEAAAGDPHDINPPPRAVYRKRNHCAYRVWDGDDSRVWGGRFKQRMSLLVGGEWERDPRPDPAVQAASPSSEAYVAAFEFLPALLPDCRNYSCL